MVVSPPACSPLQDRVYPKDYEVHVSALCSSRCPHTYSHHALANTHTHSQTNLPKTYEGNRALLDKLRAEHAKRKEESEDARS